jgi:phosphoribosylaminoimidazole-succinocarboxamide synthase
MAEDERPSLYPGWEERGKIWLPTGLTVHSGKVRDVIDLGSELIITTTDRVSAFDRILGLVPYKGEILNRLSLFWFEKTQDIVPNHIIDQVSGRTVRAAKCTVFPVEVVVRGYLTGSAWRDYQAGRAVSGVTLPSGLRFNERLDQPIITPSTKEEQGAHDRPISAREIVTSGLVPPHLWTQIEQSALALFRRGTEIAAERGLILVDTKYEFGMLDGQLILADEVHTPDSSRYFYADTYKSRFEAGERQRQMDKEFLRNWLADHGFTGDGDPPVIPETVIEELSNRYRTTFGEITGNRFTSEGLSPEAERETILYTIHEWMK